jgi:integrase/recombinase XerD
VAVALPADLDTAFADFLRIDVANGDASEDTITGYRNAVESWVAWCIEHGFDPATVTTAHIKRYRQALIEAKYNTDTRHTDLRSASTAVVYWGTGKKFAR